MGRAVHPGGNLPQELVAKSFGELLASHMRRGTRPGGGIDRPGRRWGNKELADAVGATDRTVRYWLRNEHLPPEIERIERALFGSDKRHDAWRLELRDAHATAATKHVRAPPSLANDDRPFVGVPPRIVGFTGRTRELDELEALLTQGSPAAIVQPVSRAALMGLGGIGKTSLASEYAYRSQEFYAGVWWCSAETRSGLIGSLAELARVLDVASTANADLERAARAAIDALGSQSSIWLLIYDNAQSPDSVAEFFPSRGAHVLITSRFSDWNRWANEIELDVLSIEEAIALLQFRARRVDEAGARSLAAALGRLPLAIDHAGATCRRAEMPFTVYAEKLASLLHVAPKGTAYPRSVGATFELALTEVTSECPGVEALVTYLSHCGPERIPGTLIAGLLGDEATERAALTALVEVSLVKPDIFEDGTAAFTLHRLVQAVGRERSSSAARTHAIGQLVAQLVATFPDEQTAHREPEAWRVCAKLLPHLSILLEQGLAASAHKLDWATLLTRAGGYFLGRGLVERAAPLLRDALAIRRDELGLEHPDTVTSINNVAITLKYQSDPLGAQRLFEQAIQLRERTRGPDHPDTAVSLVNLAGFLRERDQFDRARSLFERALVIFQRELGPEHPSTVECVNQLAQLLQEVDDHAGARQLHEHALAMSVAVHGQSHPSVARSLFNLALLCHSKEQDEEARSLFEKSLDICMGTLGPEHPNTLRCLDHLAKLLNDTGDYRSAIAVFQRAHDIRVSVYGAEHSFTLMAKANLGIALHRAGDLFAAKAALEEVLMLREKTLGDDHEFTAVARLNLARLLLDLDEIERASELADSTLTDYSRRFGMKHPRTIGALNVMVMALEKLGRTAEATALRELLPVPWKPS
jgi:tetratricopeptide (TPR) repeat protein